MDRVSLRIGEPSEAERIVAFVNEAFRGPYAHGGDPIDDRRFEILRGKGTFLLAERGHVLAGCVHVEANASASVLRHLAVKREIRRCGIGSQLLLAAEALCLAVRSSFIHIEVASLNSEVVRFWRTRGFVDFDQLPCPCESRSSLDCHLLKMAKQLRRSIPDF